jgi:integrase
MPKRKQRKRDQDGIFERPDSPFWWATWTDASGKTARRSTGVRREDDPRKERAKAIRAQWIVDAAEERERGPKPRKAAGPTFDDLMVLYLDGPSLEKRSHERDLYSLKRLAPVFEGRELGSLIGADARGYIAKRQAEGVSAATINKEIGLFSAALNWARLELEWTVPNPFQGRRLAEPSGRERWLTQAEAAALIQAAENLPRAEHTADYIRIGLYTGMRPGEILGLEWSRVDLSRNLIYLGAGDQKNGKVGSVPINGRAREAILSRARFRAMWCPACPWVFANREGERIASVKKSFASAVATAGLSDVHPHDLRRTFGSWLVQGGVSIQAVCTVLRHSDIRVTDRVYAHLSPDSLREAVAVLDGDVVSRSGFTLPDSIREIAAK